MTSEGDETAARPRAEVLELVAVAEELIYTQQALDEVAEMGRAARDAAPVERAALEARRRSVRAELADLMGQALRGRDDAVPLLCELAVAAYRAGRRSLDWLPAVRSAGAEGSDGNPDGALLIAWLGLRLAEDALLRATVEDVYGPELRVALEEIGYRAGAPRVALIRADQCAGLERAAARAGVPPAELVRGAIEAFLDDATDRPCA